MRIDTAVKRRRPLSLTSLIDVIFLLLLFFMLSSTFTRFAEMEMTAGPAGAASISERPDVLLRLDGGKWRVNGLSFEPDAAIGELARLHEAGARSAVVLVRGDLTSQQLVSAVERIRRDTGLILSVAR